MWSLSTFEYTIATASKAIKVIKVIIQSTMNAQFSYKSSNNKRHRRKRKEQKLVFIYNLIDTAFNISGARGAATYIYGIVIIARRKSKH